MRIPKRLLAAALVLPWLAGDVRGQKANFSSESQVVVLHVAVRDRKGYVSGLEQKAFRVLENRQPQAVSFFSSQDTPVTVGLIIDSSGSMAANRDRVIAAAVAFAENSNPNDDIFALAFNEHVRSALPDNTPFTRDVPTLRAALYGAIGGKGQSGVYNAIDAGLKYLEKGKYERKVLVLVSDGGDNASAMSRAQILAKAQASNALIYTIGVIDPLETEADPKFLRQLSAASGGESFEPHRVADVTRVLQQVAHDIRNMYTVGYVPAIASQKEELRSVSVEVTLPGGGTAKVRTRRAYLAGHDAESADDAVQR
jgi:Ca-activated chloride channel family protein